MLTREQIQEMASATVREHGMSLVHELNNGDNFGGGNLVALLEVFGDRLLSQERERTLYRCCAKHEGQSWAMTASVMASVRQVCPLCEPA